MWIIFLEVSLIRGKMSTGHLSKSIFMHVFIISHAPIVTQKSGLLDRKILQFSKTIVEIRSRKVYEIRLKYT